MSAPKFTPGPWSAEAFHTGVSVVRAPNGLIVAKCGCEGAREVGRHKTDARLIAAAPDLYEALRELVDRRDVASYGRPQFRDGSDGRYTRARAALAKAEGK